MTPSPVRHFEPPMSDPISDLRTPRLHSLVARWRQGDRLAADELIRCVAPRLECLAHQMLRRFPAVRGREQTADVVQQTNVRLLQALEKMMPSDTAHFFALAAQHVRYHLLDVVKALRRGVPQPLDGQAEPVAAGTAREDVEDLDRWQAFHEAVEQLSEEERRVVDLRFYQGLSWPQIAEVLGGNERTARRRWERAAVTLAEMLGDRAPEADEQGG
jgi:RNA polymerase sigma factor (sigma-70 family)